MHKNIFLWLLVVTCLTINAQVPQLNLVQLATGYASPVDIKHCGDNRIFVVEQRGRIYILYKDGSKQTTPFMILDSVQAAGNEQGLLGLAFSPNFKQDGYFYLNYTFGANAGSTRISRFSVFPNDSTQADPTTEKVLLTFTQPYSNHNGGNMMFGPDGYLYVSTGDGGSSNDPGNRAQNKDSYLGKMLRIDVTGQNTYAIPPTNPFVGQANTKAEIWSYGLRNPWRCSFDRIAGDMWIGDVGQYDWEEIDFQPASSAGGENYGWKCREGAHPVNNCTVTGYTDPVFEVAQNSGTSCSITGGYVYRGTQYGKLFGLYLFTDYCSGRFWSIEKTGSNTFIPTTLQTFSSFQYTSLGEDNLGELYVAFRCSTATCGKIFRLVETSDCKPTAFVSLNDSISGCRPLKLTALKGDTLSYQWYSSSGIITGETSNEFTPTQSGWYKVHVAKQQQGCETMSDSVYVTLSDTSALSITDTDTLICISEPSFIMNNYTSPVGGEFSGNGVVNNSFVPAVAGVGTSTISYLFTNLSGCESQVNFNLEVGEATTLTINVPNTNYCSTDADFSLDGFVTPAGGTYSGSAVNGNFFSPSSAVPGDSRVYYTYNNSYGCESIDSFLLSVIECVGVNDEHADLRFGIFPNPNKGSFSITISTDHNLQTELLITDALGKILLHQNQIITTRQSVIDIELPQLSKGVYWVQLKTPNSATVKTFVVE